MKRLRTDPGFPHEVLPTTDKRNVADGPEKQARDIYHCKVSHGVKADVGFCAKLFLDNRKGQALIIEDLLGVMPIVNFSGATSVMASSAYDTPAQNCIWESIDSPKL